MENNRNRLDRQGGVTGKLKENICRINKDCPLTLDRMTTGHLACDMCGRGVKMCICDDPYIVELVGKNRELKAENKAKSERIKELEAAIRACIESNDAGEIYSSPTADSASALCNLFCLLDGKGEITNGSSNTKD